MRTLGKVAAVTGLLALCLWVIGDTTWPGYTHRYRLICEVEVDGQIHTGSSVFEVTWRTEPGMSAAAWSTDVRGDAVFVDLGDRGALLIPGQTIHAPEFPAEALRYLAPVVFGGEISSKGRHDASKETLTKLSKLTGSKVLKIDEMPQFVWLKNIRDQTSAQIVLPSQFSQTVGGEAILKSLTIEMTTEPPSRHTLGRKLPWLRKAAIQERELRLSHSPGIYQLRAKDLIGNEDE